MSYVVARMQKMKSGNLGGSYKHNERIFEKHSNKDIDPERSHLNYELTDRNREISYKEQIEAYIDENKLSKRATRKDAVLCDEWIITSDKTFFENLDSDQTKEFFETAKNYFAENYGESNIAYASVHLDESTPHMHMGVVPMKNGKLSSKAMFDREELKKIQADLPVYLNEHGFDLERGKLNSDAKHLNVKEFKEKQKALEQIDEKIKAKKQKIGKLEQDLTETEDKLSSVNELYQEYDRVGLNDLKEGKFGKKTLGGKVKIDEQELKKIVKTAVEKMDQNSKMSLHQEKLKNQIRNLEKQVSNKNHLLNELNASKEEIKLLKFENRKLNDKVSKLLDKLNITTQKLQLWRGYAREYIPGKEFKQFIKQVNKIQITQTFKPMAIKAIKLVKDMVERSM
ncbi:Mobilization protein MobM [Streptococcus gordonii]|uniref:Mobilization protein MobM n=1 Tax=Streptococcus gordonii TaxID=1302 RepID=A0A139N6D1_STRGN|nr:Mobilization protein MobM [Streptococcus gordonii]